MPVLIRSYHGKINTMVRYVKILAKIIQRSCQCLTKISMEGQPGHWSLEWRKNVESFLPWVSVHFTSRFNDFIREPFYFSIQLRIHQFYSHFYTNRYQSFYRFKNSANSAWFLIARDSKSWVLGVRSLKSKWSTWWRTKTFFQFRLIVLLTVQAALLSIKAFTSRLREFSI